MNTRPRLLIGYDGSVCADAALDDLRRAGLPSEVEALVISVGDVLTLPLSSNVTAPDQLIPALEQTLESASKASQLLQAYFPEWQVSAEAIKGEPARELIQRAAQWNADLIVVGSQGRSALGRFFLGSVSKAVATKAPCSVRIARPSVARTDESRLRIIVGVDGSPGAARAIRAVSGRLWPEGTEVCSLAVDDGVSPTRIANIHPGTAELVTGHDEREAAKARVMLERAAEELRALALNASAVITEGDPQTVLIEKVQEWGANCIFIGAHGFHTIPRRPGLGRVATGLVTNAQCTVEIVR